MTLPELKYEGTAEQQKKLLWLSKAGRKKTLHSMKQSKRTKQEIDAEIAALEASKAWAPRTSFFGEDNHRTIDLQIEYLRGDIDITNDDVWEEFSEREQNAILEAHNWEEGEIDETPSSGWEHLRPAVVVRKKPATKPVRKKKP